MDVVELFYESSGYATVSALFHCGMSYLWERSNMKNRTLGGSGIDIAPLAFGGNVFGWTIDEATSFELLDTFIAAGLNLVDTADVYSKWVPGNAGGESEIILGNWMKSRGNRNRVVVATKVGMELGPDKKGLARSYIFQAVESSLKRLQTDYIDLYQSHRDDTETPLEESLGAYAELISQGKVRAIGASNYTGERLSEALAISKAHGYPRYETLQPLYNLYDRSDFESGLESVCIDNNIGVIPYFSLASGFLTGKYRSENDLTKSQRGQGNRKYLNERGFKILAALDAVSEGLNASPAQVALAWLIARPAITAPIASATKLDQLQDIIAATLLSLSTQDIELLDRASASSG